jgi:hypothetical protein
MGAHFFFAGGGLGTEMHGQHHPLYRNMMDIGSELQLGCNDRLRNHFSEKRSIEYNASDLEVSRSMSSTSTLWQHQPMDSFAGHITRAGGSPSDAHLAVAGTRKEPLFDEQVTASVREPRLHRLDVT